MWTRFIPWTRRAEAQRAKTDGSNYSSFPPGQRGKISLPGGTIRGAAKPRIVAAARLARLFFPAKLPPYEMGRALLPDLRIRRGCAGSAGRPDWRPTFRL